MQTDREVPLEVKANIKILVVDDNVLCQRLVSFLLTNWGYNYDVVSNGKQAIHILKENKYDLILLDVQMPEMNGYETAIYARNNLRLGIPIIATTAHSSSMAPERCLSSGMTDFISKPLNDLALYNLVTNYLYSTKVIHAGQDLSRAMDN